MKAYLYIGIIMSKFGQQEQITTSNKFRLDIIKTRDSGDLKIIVENFIEPCIKIDTKGWTKYLFLDNAESSIWENEIHL